MLLPEPLRLRKEIQRLPDHVRELGTEADVRETVEALNEQIVDWLRSPTGPRVAIAPVSVDDVVQRWRAEQPTVAPAEREATLPPPRRRWWQRRRR